jgi:hypothetical protein
MGDCQMVDLPQDISVLVGLEVRLTVHKSPVVHQPAWQSLFILCPKFVPAARSTAELED